MDYRGSNPLNLLSLSPKQEIEIPKPKEEEPIPEEPEGIPPATEPEPEPEPELEEDEDEDGIVSPWGMNPIKGELSEIKGSSKLNGFISVDNINVIHEHFHTINDMLLTKGMTKDDLVVIKKSISMDDSENPYLKAFTSL